MPKCLPGCTCGKHVRKVYAGVPYVRQTREERRTREREWEAANRDQLNAKERARYADNHEQVLANKARYRDKNRDRIRAKGREYRNARRGNHRLKPGESEAIWKSQGGLCCFCQRPLPRDPKLVHLDHDHTCCPSGKSCPTCRRGFACNTCNVIVGMADEDWDRLMAIAVNGRELAAKVRERIEGKPVQEALPLNVVSIDREARGA